MPNPSLKRKTLTRANRRVSVAPGERFHVDLEGTPSLGFEWFLSELKAAKQVGHKLLPSPGKSETALYRFEYEGESAGVEKLVAEYRRTWESGSQDRIEFTVTVDGD